MSGYPVLMYHALSNGPTRERYVLTQQQFRCQMAAIMAHGKSGTALSGVREKKPPVDDAVVLTFDDGHVSNLKTALPILREFGFTGTFFVTTDRIGSSGDWLSWQDLERLMDAGMDVQAHGHTHRFLDGLSTSEQYEELEEPRRLMADRLGKQVSEFSFPGGRFTKFAITTARTLGYTALCTSEPGLNAPLDGRNAYLVKRYVIHQGVSEHCFGKIVARDARYAGRVRSTYAAKQLGKRILGNKSYHYIWNKLFKRGAV